MALGTSSVFKLDECYKNVIKDIEMGNYNGTGLYSTWNTFQYVAKNLSVWTDDTTIGAEIKQQVIKLSETLYSLMLTTNKLTNRLEEFTSKQKELNGYKKDATDWKDKYRFDPGKTPGAI